MANSSKQDSPAAAAASLVRKKSRFSNAPPLEVTCNSQPGPSGVSTSTATLSGPPTKKRKSRFSDAPPATDDATISQAISSFSGPSVPTQQNLTAAQRQQILEQMEMNKLVAEIKAATQSANTERPNMRGKPKYEYDSDEETEGGTWEHKKRADEMRKTYEKAREQTLINHGKHHIGDFLPPKELDNFIEKVSAIKEGRTPGK